MNYETMKVEPVPLSREVLTNFLVNDRRVDCDKRHLNEYFDRYLDGVAYLDNEVLSSMFRGKLPEVQSYKEKHAGARTEAR